MHGEQEDRAAQRAQANPEEPAARIARAVARLGEADKQPLRIDGNFSPFRHECKSLLGEPPMRGRERTSDPQGEHT